MRTLLPVAIAVTLSGCAAHHVPPPAPSRDWAVVARLPPGTNVVAYTRGVTHQGRLEAVGPDDIVLRTGHGLTSIARTEVFLLSRRTPMAHERKWNMLTDALVFSMVGALFLPKIDDDLTFMAIVAGSGAAVGAMARPRMYRDRTIYVRP
jgi:hypothetical protein